MLIDPKTMFAGKSYSFFQIDAGLMRAAWAEALGALQAVDFDLVRPRSVPGYVRSAR